MCGIVGYVQLRGQPDPALPAHIERARDTLTHRGPDDRGLYVSPDGRCVLAHRRLSILDLSAAGHQPMANEDATVWIVFNGEIYNFLELREQLERRGHTFRSRTDTEVILHLYEDEGPDLVARLDGMFAFVIYDLKNARLLAARDRLGVKPLYFSHSPHRWAFASEPKALLALPDVSREPRLDQLPNYLTFNCVPGPPTLYRDIEKLEPGSRLVIDLRDGSRRDRYWLPGTPCPVTTRHRASLLGWLEEGLQTASVKRMIADVPFGAMLSGGIDSSLVVALMSQAREAPITTFTVGYAGDERDTESDLQYARMVARAFKTDHHEVVLSDDQIAHVLDDLPSLADDPIGAPSVTANVHLAAFAKASGVTVVQVGEGADEVFAGYAPVRRLWRLRQRWALLSRLAPRALCRWTADALTPLVSRIGSPSLIGALDATLEEHLRRYGRRQHLHWGHGVLFNSLTLRRLLANGRPAVDPYQCLKRRTDAVPAFSERPFLDQLTLIDLLVGLPERLLMRVDKASMLSSIEARVPFLDPAVVDVAFRAPSRLRARRPKGLLVAYAQQQLPREILERRKQGFPTAQRVFLSPTVFRRIRATVSDPRFVDTMGFDAEEVRRLLDSVRHAQSPYFYHIWSLYVLSLWFRCWVDPN